MFTVVLPGRDKVQGALSSCFLKAVLRDGFGLFACSLSLCRDRRGFGCFLSPPVGVRQNRSLHRSQQKAWLWLGRRVPTCWPLLPGCCWGLVDVSNTPCLQGFGVLVVLFFYFIFNWKIKISCNLEKEMPSPKLTGLSMPGPRHPVFRG